jgi:HAD superfamily hydrolase (TIGR01484 family)
VKPLSELRPEDVRGVRGLLFDLDDTLLTHGTLTREAYSALWDLKERGLTLVAVTGRPSGWGEVIARQWPVAGLVTENGAVHVVREGRGVALREDCGDEERALRRARLGEIAEKMRKVAPEARLADDVRGRWSDIAWDIGERAQLPRDRVDAMARVITEAGARTVRSSVHLHATFDADDKATGALAFLARELGWDRGEALWRWAFVGDSANDAACFAAFRATFGVANVAGYVGSMPVPPRWIASREMGAGFVEIALRLLQLADVPSLSIAIDRL